MPRRWPARTAIGVRPRSTRPVGAASTGAEQIAGRLPVDVPEEPEMSVSTETVYQSLYVQSRGALRRELARE